MINFKVTEHFTFFELTATRSHPELQAANGQYFLVEPYLDRLKAASEYLLEEIRDKVECPVIVTSGGRCPELNEAVGGVPKSQHLFANYGDGAFDFYVPGVSIDKVAAEVWATGLLFYQMRVYADRNFIHIGMPRSKNNLQIAWIGGDRPEWAK